MGNSPSAHEAWPVLLYDGDCGLCAASVQFVLRHEGQRTLRFAPLDGPLAAGVRDRHPEIQGVDSMVWVEGAGTAREVVAVRSAAVLRVAGYLGGPWRILRLGAVLPRRLRDGLYDVVARHRHRLVGRAKSCFVPQADARARFLD